MDYKIKILILDDSRDLLEALKMFLEDKLYIVCTVYTAKQLTEALFVFKPDLIIIDIYLNGKAEGRDICRIIKSDIETKHIPIILMSASKKALENYEECQADTIIEKPFNLMELVQQIESVTTLEG